MIVKLKPLSWFQQHAFADNDGDFWETEELRNSYNHEDNKMRGTSLYSLCVNNNYAGKVLPYIGAKDYKRVAWAVATIITKREHPEYFI